MKELIIWAGMIVFIYLMYELFVVRKPKAFDNMKKGKELTILKNKFKLDFNKLDMKRAIRLIAITNAFMISTVVTVVVSLQNYINNILLWALAVMLVGILLLLPLMWLFYSMIGKSLARKQGGSKNV